MRPALATALLLLACGTDRVDHGATPVTSDGGAAAFEVGGAVVGDAPASAKVIAVWHGGHDGEEWLYKLGEGTTAGATVSLRFTAPPSGRALANGNVAIGWVLLVAADRVVPDGDVDDHLLRDIVLGGAPAHLLVYKGDGATFPFWITRFPPGWSCAGPYFERPGDPEGFTPVPCADVRIEMGPFVTLPFADWH